MEPDERSSAEVAETRRLIEEVRGRVVGGAMSKEQVVDILLSALDALDACSEGLDQALRAMIHRRLG